MVPITALMGFLLLSGAMGALPAHANPVRNLISNGANAPALPALPNYAVTLTAYNAVPEQTDSDPFMTASGVFSNPEVVAARAPDLADELPFGTIIEIDGSTVSSEDTCGYHIVAPIVGYRVIADAMSADSRFHNHVDILLDTKTQAEALGVCEGMTIRVVGHVGIKRIPETQKELAALVQH